MAASTAMPLAAALSYLLLTTACGLPVGRRPIPPDREPPSRDPGPVAGRDAREDSRYQTKRVADKRPINLLVADDLTVCRVPRERYDATRIGEVVWCVWQPDA
jgi:hypothetical protein